MPRAAAPECSRASGIERLVAAEAQVGPAGADQGLDLGQNETVRDRRRDGDQLGGKTVALGYVEHGEALQERDRVRLVALLPRTCALLVRDESVGEHHRRAALAFADIAAKTECLAKGQPALAWEAMLDNGPPQDEHVDTGIAALGRGVLRHGERRLSRRCAPRLHPRQPPGLQLGDNFVSDS